MLSLETSCRERIAYAHLSMDRAKRAQVVLVHGEIVLEAVLESGSVCLSMFRLMDGFPVGSMILPFEAFEEILDLVISFGMA